MAKTHNCANVDREAETLDSPTEGTCEARENAGTETSGQQPRKSSAWTRTRSPRLGYTTIPSNPKSEIPNPKSKPLTDHAMYHFPRHVGQPKVAPGVAIGEFLVVHPEQMKHSRVEIVHVDLVGDRPITDLVGRAVGKA